MSLHADEEGTALLAILALIAFLLALSTALWTIQHLQRRLVRGTVVDTQLRYEAEACLHRFLAANDTSTVMRPLTRTLTLASGRECQLHSTPFGAFLLLTARIAQAQHRIALSATAGVASPHLQTAVHLTGEPKRLVLAGSTRVRGTIVTPMRPSETAAFNDRPFTGHIDGPSVIDMNDAESYNYFPALLRTELYAFDRLIDRVRQPSAYAAESFVDRAASAAPPPRIVFGNLRLSELDAGSMVAPVRIIVSGNLLLDSEEIIPAGSRLLAGGAIVVSSAQRCNDALLYGRSAIRIQANRGCAAQYLTQGHLVVTRGSHLPHPTLLYSSGRSLEAAPAIRLEEGSTVDGIVLQSATLQRLEPLVVIERDAIVRGIVLNAAATELRGRVWGSVISAHFYLYEPPTHFLDWLVDAEIDVRRRPAYPLLPFGSLAGATTHVRSLHELRAIDTAK